MADARASHHELLTSLQAGRAIAAIMVAFFHSALYIFALDKYWGYDPTDHFIRFGHAGVEFFFVLSGFIILFIHKNDMGQPARFFPYTLKRFLRIYPIYWIVLAVVLATYMLVPSYGLPGHRRIGTVLSSLLLVHVNGNSDSELASAWTLYHEILFYGLFSLAILHKRFGLAVMTAWLLVSAVTLLAKPAWYPLAFLFSPFHLLFGMGMLSCWMVTRIRVWSPGLIALAGVALFVAAAYDEDYVAWLQEMPRNLIYGAGSALMVIGAVELERQGRFKVPAAVLLTGNASYVIYLVNFTVLSCLAKIFIYMGAKEAIPGLASYLVISSLSVLIGILIYLYLERPLLRQVRTWLPPRAALQPAPYAAA